VVAVSLKKNGPGDVARLDKLGLESWAPGARNHFLRIVPAIVTGRKLRGSLD